ncbi:hypothetical protein [Asaia astilbis]|uniref:hypothetical protein n=1 Tax=Asaia astilbis TaxID=610244 RepID=UPI000471C1CA|nr:hypothetical protein [Asaia astilbis]
MSNFTHEQDVFIALYFEVMGAEHLARVDLPQTEREIEERFKFLKESRPEVFREAERDMAAFDALIEHDLTQSMIEALVEISNGSTSLGRGKGITVSALRSRGLVGPNRMRYELTEVGSQLAKLFQEGGKC